LGELPSHVVSPDPTLYRGNNYVVIDFETTARLKGSPVCEDNHIVLACWKVSGGETRYCFASEFEQNELVAAVEAADFIVAHNAKFELGWLRRCGVDLRKTLVFCTMVGEYVIGGNRYHPSQLGLDRTLARYNLGSKDATVGWMIKQGFPVERIPRRWLLRYCIRDVEAAEELFLAQRRTLRELGLEAVAYQRNLVSPALADLEFNGMQLDCEKVLELEEKEEQNYISLTNALTDFCEGIAPSKAKQLAEYVYSELGFAVPKDYRGRPMLTATGAYSVKADVMEKLVGRTRNQKEFLHLYRAWTESNGRLTKYLRKFGECVREANGS
jgi:DNA polymerase I-like protein with 3'-5' exonuclease and polymerase domains